MTYSMTAYAQAWVKTSSGDLSCELRSVNHRFLEIAPRIPEELRSQEQVVRETIQAKLARGRIDCYIKFDHSTQPASVCNEAEVTKLAELLVQVKGVMPELPELRAVDVLRWPGVLESKTTDSEELEDGLRKAVTQAVDELLLARASEGKKLVALLHARLDEAGKIVDDTTELIPEITKLQRQRLTDKLDQLNAEVDPDRIEQELIIILNKADVAEELDRLRVHLSEVKSVLTANKPAGRRLDFLMQELNREANTLGSKSVDARLTKASVDLKVLIEQMREQVQNIE